MFELIKEGRKAVAIEKLTVDQEEEDQHTVSPPVSEKGEMAYSMWNVLLYVSYTKDYINHLIIPSCGSMLYSSD